MMANLRYTNERVQYAAQICAFNIRSITHKQGFVPQKSEVFRHVQGFVYQYENYCFRAYAFREKLLKFINAVLPVGFDDRDVKILSMTRNAIVRRARLIPLIERFENRKNLKKIISDRNSLTHKLYYKGTFDHYLRPTAFEPKNDDELKKWCMVWKKEIMGRSKLTNDFTRAVSHMNHDLARKIISYKQIPRRIYS